MRHVLDRELQLHLTAVDKPGLAGNPDIFRCSGLLFASPIFHHPFTAKLELIFQSS